jgi:hypothetical protein
MKEEVSSQTATPSTETTTIPTELQGKGLPTVAGPIPLAPEDSKSLESQHDSTKELSKEHGQYAYFVHQYIRDFIKFADQKAAFIMAIASAILAFLIKQDAHKSLLTPIRDRGLPEWAAFSSLLLIAIAALLALLVVLPRLSSKGKGIIYWKGILLTNSSANYAAKIQTLDDDKLVRAILDHTYELAEIADRKYELLKWATWIGAIGSFAAVIVLLGL